MPSRGVGGGTSTGGRSLSRRPHFQMLEETGATGTTGTAGAGAASTAPTAPTGTAEADAKTQALKAAEALKKEKCTYGSTVPGPPSLEEAKACAEAEAALKTAQAGVTPQAAAAKEDHTMWYVGAAILVAIVLELVMRKKR